MQMVHDGKIVEPALHHTSTEDMGRYHVMHMHEVHHMTPLQDSREDTMYEQKT